MALLCKKKNYSLFVNKWYQLVSVVLRMGSSTLSDFTCYLSLTRGNEVAGSVWMAITGVEGSHSMT
jgi:hypothetical protein